MVSFRTPTETSKHIQLAVLTRLVPSLIQISLKSTAFFQCQAGFKVSIYQSNQTNTNQPYSTEL